MAKVVLQRSRNRFHSDVIAEDQDLLEKNLRRTLAHLSDPAKSPPVTISTDELSLELDGLTEAEYSGNIELMSSTANHALMSPWTGNPATRELCQRLVDNGVKGNSGYFFPEFDIASREIKLPGSPIVPILTDDTVSSYDLGNQDISYQEPLLPHEAFYSGDRIIVPMYGLMVGQKREPLFQKGLQRLQLFPFENQTRDNFAQIIFKYAESTEKMYYLVPMDLESHYVGSHHKSDGVEIFTDFVREYGVTSVFASFSEAEKYWRQEAQEAPQLGYNHQLQRNLGVKWTAYAKQLEHIELIKRGVNNWKGDPDHLYRLWQVASASDLGSAIFRKLGGTKTLIGDMGPITIDCDPNVILTCLAAAKGIMENSIQYGIDELRRINSSLSVGCAKFLEAHL